MFELCKGTPDALNARWPKFHTNRSNDVVILSRTCAPFFMYFNHFLLNFES